MKTCKVIKDIHALNLRTVAPSVITIRSGQLVDVTILDSGKGVRITQGDDVRVYMKVSDAEIYLEDLPDDD